MNKTEINATKTVLASLFWHENPIQSGEASLVELESLVETAGGTVVGIITQNRNTPEARSYMGEGKLEELKELMQNTEAELVVFDNELSPSQIRNIENATDAKVFDRSMLILEIFNLHATTSEGKIQVEMAQLKYTLPRLTGKGLVLSRLGGGGGMGARRGSGETKLEIDRRRARERIAFLRTELAEIKKNRAEQRRARGEASIPKVAIIGYTNAGKSTLLNTLTGANVLAENKLFATLDPTTKKLRLKNGFEMLLTDTVGFIQNLPHHLVDAFSSTLDEVCYADVLLHVLDASDEDCDNKFAVSNKLISELGAVETPQIIALNKADLCEHTIMPRPLDSVEISAKNGDGVEELLDLIYKKLAEKQRVIEAIIPYDKGFLLEKLHKDAVILEKDYREGGTYVKVRGVDAVLGKIETYELQNG